MSDTLRILDLEDVRDFMLTCQKQDEADAIEWAIDQLSWQPIETAPKDTPILVYSRCFTALGIRIAKYYDGSWRGQIGGVQRNPPTHWMPLPDPPEAP